MSKETYPRVIARPGSIEIQAAPFLSPYKIEPRQALILSDELRDAIQVCLGEKPKDLPGQQRMWE